MVGPKAPIILANKGTSQVFDQRRAWMRRANMIRVSEVGNIIMECAAIKNVRKPTGDLRLVARTSQSRNSFVSHVSVSNRRIHARSIDVVSVSIIENRK